MKAAMTILVCIVLLAIAVPLYGYFSLCYPHAAHGIC